MLMGTPCFLRCVRKHIHDYKINNNLHDQPHHHKHIHTKRLNIEGIDFPECPTDRTQFRKSMTTCINTAETS